MISSTAIEKGIRGVGDRRAHFVEKIWKSPWPFLLPHCGVSFVCMQNLLPGTAANKGQKGTIMGDNKCKFEAKSFLTPRQEW